MQAYHKLFCLGIAFLTEYTNNWGSKLSKELENTWLQCHYVSDSQESKNSELLCKNVTQKPKGDKL